MITETAEERGDAGTVTTSVFVAISQVQCGAAVWRPPELRVTALGRCNPWNRTMAARVLTCPENDPSVGPTVKRYPEFSAFVNVNGVQA